jgi:hypothetical protein
MIHSPFLVCKDRVVLYRTQQAMGRDEIYPFSTSKPRPEFLGGVEVKRRHSVPFRLTWPSDQDSPLVTRTADDLWNTRRITERNFIRTMSTMSLRPQELRAVEIVCSSENKFGIANAGESGRNLYEVSLKEHILSLLRQPFHMLTGQVCENNGRTNF